MKKLLFALVMITSVTTACAHGHHGHHNHQSWVGPAIVTGMIGYSIGMASQRSYAQPQVIIAQPPYPAYRPAEPVYQEVFEYDSYCNCYYKRVKQVGWR